MRAIIWSTLLLLPCVSVLHANTADAKDLVTEDQFALNVKVVMADGFSASGAIVQSVDIAGTNKTVANAAGVAVLHDEFRDRTNLHAMTADGKFQATKVIPPAELRRVLASNVILTLLPARSYKVTVRSKDLPVNGAHIVVSGIGFRVFGSSDQQGHCNLLLPAQTPLLYIVAWHPKLGVDGIRSVSHGIDTDMSQLSLREPAPHSVRMIDKNGNPVSGLKIGVSVRTEDSDWILTRSVAAAHTQTDEDGEAKLTWIPAKELKYVDVDLLSSDWKIDEINRKQIEKGITTVRVRRLIPVTGRIKMPGGVSAKGLLVTGSGFGPYNNGHVPQARASENGTFAMRVSSAHGYVLGISDTEWSSDLWTGIILGADTDNPKRIELEAYPATPLMIKVTRGSDRKPLKDVWVYVSRIDKVSLIDSSGNPRTRTTGISNILLTNSEGIASTGIGKGVNKVQFNSGDWRGSREIEVESFEPIEMEFHRPWKGKRRITARLTLSGHAYKPSPDLVTHAWTEQVDRIYNPKMLDDGTIEVNFDHTTMSLLVIDRKRSLSGFVSVGPGDTSVEIEMLTTANYSGMMLDENGKPLVDRTVRLTTKTSRLDVVESQRTDEKGGFQFSGVAVGTPLRLYINDERDLPEYFLFESDRLFVPGEKRTGDKVKPNRMDAPDKTADSVLSIVERIESTCQNTRVSNMLTLVILQGDDSERVLSSASRITSYEENKTAFGFLPVIVSSAQLNDEAKYFEKMHWPKPNPREISLIVLDGKEQTVATKRIGAGDVNAAVNEGAKFLKRNMLPSRDALLMLAEGKRLAKSSDRRIWLIEGGPRCGPCFRLSRWIEEHHKILEKDYVIVKLMRVIDENVTAIMNELPKTSSGIPWHAIIEPDGKVLYTSEGPLGNIGMPGSIEGKRHFRKMLAGTARKLSSSDIDQLIKSL